MNASRLGATALAAALLVTPAFAKPAKKRAPGNPCSFAHYPIAVGDVNEYQMTSVQLDAEKKVLQTTTNTYSEEIVALDERAFRTKWTSAENSTESEWTCGKEGIALKFAEYPEMKITTTGVSIPAEMKVGGVWNQTFESESAGSSQRSKTVNRVTKREEVVVPAGTFDAFRVDYEVETTVPELPPTIVRGTQWFAPDVGVVKSTSVVTMNQDEIHSVETTIELLKRTRK